jgi:hypothetical protein
VLYEYGGAGGAGLPSSITGSSVTYAGGGGGGSSYNPGAGGAGGGGRGSNGGGGSDNPGSGVANTGGGGGGWNGGYHGLGGSGVVVIAYPNSFPAPTSIDAGLSYDQPSRTGYRVYRFTAGTGTITF